MRISWLYFSTRSARRTGLEMTSAQRHGEVGNEAVHRFAAAVRHHGTPVGAIGQLHRCHSFTQRAGLVELDQHGVGGIGVDALLDALNIGDKHVIAHQFELTAKFTVEQLPAFPVVFRQAVFQHAEGVFLHPVGVWGRRQER